MSDQKPKSNITVHPEVKIDPFEIEREMQRERQRIEIETARAHSRGQKFYYQMQIIWSIILGVILIMSMVFEIWLAYGVGRGSLNFEKYQTFLWIIAGENFVQIVALCTIVVNFLFPKKRPN